MEGFDIAVINMKVGITKRKAKRWAFKWNQQVVRISVKKNLELTTDEVSEENQALFQEGRIFLLSTFTANGWHKLKAIAAPPWPVETGAGGLVIDRIQTCYQWRAGVAG